MTGLSVEALAILHPLQSLPSMLALRDVRRRVMRCQEHPIGAAEVVSLLEIDPLSTLRVMRFAHAPFVAQDRPIPRSIPELVAAVGHIATLRILDVPVVDPDRTKRLRSLWFHSIATACAARRLASRTGVAPPDVAYLRGLLHDLTPWLQLLGLHHNGERSRLDGFELARAWRLPIDAATLRRTELPVDRPAVDCLAAQPHHLVTVAEAFAELAGYCHPDSSGSAARAERLAASSREELAEAHEIAADVESALGRFGLDRTGDDSPNLADGIDDEFDLFGGPRQGDTTDLLMSLLASRDAKSMRELRTLACSAALRHLDIDRVFVIHVDTEQRRAWFRGKADLSRLPLAGTPIEVGDREFAQLLAIIADGEPRILVRDDPPHGICASAAADRMLAAPLLTKRRIASFVLLDRALTSRPLEERSDGRAAAVLAGCTALVSTGIELHLRRQRAERDAVTDSLTRLTNRRAGLSQLSQEIARAERAGTPLCVLMLDLDDFKQLNDQLGHLAGDRALRLAAEVLKRTCRQADLLCRFGGEEFLAALPDTDHEEATVLATRLFTAVADVGERHNLPLTVSIGLAARRAGERLDELVHRADRALYASKARGRNRFSIDA